MNKIIKCGFVCFMIASGITITQVVSKDLKKSQPTALDRLLNDKNYPALERALPNAKLDRPTQLYFMGILEDRMGKAIEAIRDLETALPILTKNNPREASQAIYALSQDEFILGHYNQATSYLNLLLKQYSTEFSKADLSNINDNFKIYSMLRAASPQTVSGETTFKLHLTYNALGDIEIPLKAGGSNASWIFDTGANITTISYSTAKLLKLNILEGHAQTQSGATGLEVPLSIAVIPHLQVGGAVIKNVVAFVLKDKDLNINLGGGKHHQIQGILGYPVLKALGSFKLNGMQMMVAPQSTGNNHSTRLYVEQLTPMVAADFQGKSLLFQFDTGNSGIELTAKFKRRFPNAGIKSQVKSGYFSGAGQPTTISVFTLHRLTLQFGSDSVSFSRVTVVGRDRDVAPLDDLYGNLGQVLLSQFKSYTIDFKNMRFTPGDRVSHN